jgi:hypothetical protein
LKVFKHTGLSVVSVSIAVSILCLPLYAVAEKRQQLERNIRKKLKPKIDKIKAVFISNYGNSPYKRETAYHINVASLILHLEGPDTTQLTLDPKKGYYIHINIFDPSNWEKAEK